MAGTLYVRLYLRNNYCFRFTNRLARPTSHAILRPDRIRLDREAEYIHRAELDTLLAPVASVRFDVYQIDFEIA